MTLWYAWQHYEIWTDWTMPDEEGRHEWDTYGAELLFRAGKGYFKVSFSQSQEPLRGFFWNLPPGEMGYATMGPFEEKKIEISWYPFRQLKLTTGFNKCPDSADDSMSFSAKLDLASWLSLGYYVQQSTVAPPRLEADAAYVVLRF